MAIITSYGAAEMVTGSAHLLKLENGMEILIDCGMFQGEDEDKNYEPLNFNPEEIDFLIITHAHLDHIGRIPLLKKSGFHKTIISTQATLDLGKVVLLDSAKLMREDYEIRYKKAQRRGTQNYVKKPLYTTDDVEDIYNLEMRYAEYDKSIEIGKDTYATFRNAGHILGSATVEIDFLENGINKKIVFSGDLGNKNDYVLPAPEIIKKADALYIESTYGDRNHKDLKETIAEFKDALLSTLARGGNVLIPSFAIERTQEILCLLKEMYRKKELPECSIFLDSPMAIKATNIYKEQYQLLSKTCNDMLEYNGSIFQFPYLKFAGSIEESKKINDVKSGAVIIAGSGMCTGGRILHHFKHRLWDEKNTLIFVGYQARGTLGRRIIDGAEWIKIYHEQIRVMAKIYMINGFSAHADQSEMIEWMKKFDQLAEIFLIHGEEEKQIIFKNAIKDSLNRRAHIVALRERIYV